VLDVEKKLLKVIPAEFKHNAHHWLILHGRYTCKARKPQCSQCMIQDLCEYPHKFGLSPLVKGGQRGFKMEL
jgi:endonuclease-3